MSSGIIGPGENMQLDLDDIARTFNALAIARALINSMTTKEAINNFDLTFKQNYKIRIDLINRLKQLCTDNRENRKQTREFITKLDGLEKETPSKKRKMLDYTLDRLIEHLPPQEQISYIEKYIKSRRATRRKIALNIIARNFQPEHKHLIISSFERYRNQQSLIVLTRVEVDLTDIAAYLVENIENRYEKARVFEKLAYQNYKIAVELSKIDPLAFVWGVGRANYEKAKPEVFEIIKNWSGETDKGLIIWSLKKLQAKKELQELAREYEVDIRNFPHLW